MTAPQDRHSPGDDGGWADDTTTPTEPAPTPEPGPTDPAPPPSPDYPDGDDDE